MSNRRGNNYTHPSASNPAIVYTNFWEEVEVELCVSHGRPYLKGNVHKVDDGRSSSESTDDSYYANDLSDESDSTEASDASDEESAAEE